MFLGFMGLLDGSWLVFGGKLDDFAFRHLSCSIAQELSLAFLAGESES